MFLEHVLLLFHIPVSHRCLQQNEAERIHSKQTHGSHLCALATHPREGLSLWRLILRYDVSSLVVFRVFIFICYYFTLRG